MSYLRLATKYKRILAAGFLLTFFSGFGQSFFISNFTQEFLAAFSLDRATFGTVYSSATLTSGLLLIWLGGRLDHANPIRYTLGAATGLAAACFTLALAPSIFLFWLALFGLRLFGQGLFGHISATIIARGFLTSRGRALSLTALGYPASEAILPTVGVLLVATIGWRWSWSVLGAVLLFGFIPLIPILMKGNSEVIAEAPEKTHEPRRVPAFAKSWRFWFYVFGSSIPPLVLTALFLYHGTLVDQKGWTMAWMASSFAAFAAMRVLFSLVAGKWIDAYGATKLFPAYLVPFAIGLGTLSLESNSPWLAPAYLGLSGITAGLAGPLITALWAELYGTRQIARIRSWTMAFVVISTAAGPPLLGRAIDNDFAISTILKVVAAVCLGYSAVSLLVRRV